MGEFNRGFYYAIGDEGTMNTTKLIIARELLGAEFLPYHRQ